MAVMTIITKVTDARLPNALNRLFKISDGRDETIATDRSLWPVVRSVSGVSTIQATGMSHQPRPAGGDGR